MFVCGWVAGHEKVPGQGESCGWGCVDVMFVWGWVAGNEKVPAVGPGGLHPPPHGPLGVSSV